MCGNRTTASKNHVVCARCHFVGLASAIDCTHWSSTLRGLAALRLAARTSAKWFARAARSVVSGMRGLAGDDARSRFLVMSPGSFFMSMPVVQSSHVVEKTSTERQANRPSFTIHTAHWPRSYWAGPSCEPLTSSSLGGRGSELAVAEAPKLGGARISRRRILERCRSGHVARRELQSIRPGQSKSRSCSILPP